MSDYFFPSPDFDVCFNCRYYCDAIAVGQGLRCTHPLNRDGQKPMLIPSRYYSCKHFSRNEKRLCNQNFSMSDETLKRIARAISELEQEARLKDEEPNSPTVTFTFEAFGRRVAVSLAGCREQISVEEPKR